MTYIIYFLFFVLGVSTVKTFDFLFNLGCSVLILKGAELTALNIIVTLAEDVSFMREIKYANLKRAGSSDSEVEIIKLVDDQTLQNWKDSVIKKIITAYPHSYRERLAYQDWKGALKYLDYLAKNKKLDF
tara:strand:+ start:318 stop:707 length:390 start_codon:yes stop_codon:yes gene_type:complete